LLIAGVALFAAAESRKPDLLTHPQFWADEAKWYADAYGAGSLRAVFKPQGGYLCVGSKIPDALAVHLPLHEAPLALNVFALGLQTVMALFIMTSRWTAVMPLVARMLLALLWIAVPNEAEVDSLSNTQWMFAILTIAILVANQSVSTAWRAFDLLVTAITSLTGPFCLLLLPIACVLAFVRRSRALAVLAALLAIGCVVQIYNLLHLLKPCHADVLNTSGLRVLAAQIFVLGTLLSSPIALNLSAVVCLLGLAAATYGAWRASLEFKLFVLFGALVLASLTRRSCEPGWIWSALLTPEYAARYWYIPRLVFLTVLVSLVTLGHPLWLRVLSGTALLWVAVFAATHWQYAPLPDMHFQHFARAFEQAPVGTRMSIPVAPPGWTLDLTKR
jgi:hypothetical protein